MSQLGFNEITKPADSHLRVAPVPAGVPVTKPKRARRDERKYDSPREYVRFFSARRVAHS
jgi:hypothetical protein